MLHVYGSITPTSEKAFFFTNPTQLLTRLQSKEITAFSPDKYTINGLSIRLALVSSLTQVTAFSVTYLYDDYTKIGYNVTRALVQSGYAFFDLEVDEWTSYFWRASISDIVVKRCNRSITNTGILDDIRATHGSAIRKYVSVLDKSSGEDNEYFDVNKVYVVFNLKYNVVQTQSGSATRNALFAVKVNLLKTTLVAEALAMGAPEATIKYLSKLNAVTWTANLVGGIYQAYCSGTWNGASVVEAWITDLVQTEEQPQDTNFGFDKIKVKAKIDRDTDMEFYPLLVKPQLQSNVINVTPSNNYNKQYYFGSTQSGMKVMRYAKDIIGVRITCIAGTDRLSIIVNDGDSQQDITDAFRFNVGGVDGDLSTKRQMLDAFQNGTRTIGGALSLVRGGMCGDLMRIGIGATQLGSGITGMFSEKTSVGNVVSGGDGATGFYNPFSGSDSHTIDENVNTPLSNPYNTTEYASLDNEVKKARLYGAKFNAPIDALSSVFNASLIGGEIDMTDTYIECDCLVENIPVDAREKIKSMLNGGIYLEDIR